MFFVCGERDSSGAGGRGVNEGEDEGPGHGDTVVPGGLRCLQWWSCDYWRVGNRFRGCPTQQVL